MVEAGGRLNVPKKKLTHTLSVFSRPLFIITLIVYHHHHHHFHHQHNELHVHILYRWRKDLQCPSNFSYKFIEIFSWEEIHAEYFQYTKNILSLDCFFHHRPETFYLGCMFPCSCTCCSAPQLNGSEGAADSLLGSSWRWLNTEKQRPAYSFNLFFKSLAACLHYLFASTVQIILFDLQVLIVIEVG